MRILRDHRLQSLNAPRSWLWQRVFQFIGNYLSHSLIQCSPHSNGPRSSGVLFV
ncbi:hypothetical protein NC652_024905 [Populus alba x Populus x berolinensis]|nr:hypothetical protein NC652_024905 [Populus alba x Populus x berolinensis]